MDSYPAAMSIIIVIDFANGRAIPSTAPTVHPSIPGIRDEGRRRDKNPHPHQHVHRGDPKHIVVIPKSLARSSLSLWPSNSPSESLDLVVSRGHPDLSGVTHTGLVSHVHVSKSRCSGFIAVIDSIFCSPDHTQWIDTRWGVSTQTDQPTTMYLLCYSIINYV